MAIEVHKVESFEEVNPLLGQEGSLRGEFARGRFVRVAGAVVFSTSQYEGPDHATITKTYFGLDVESFNEQAEKGNADAGILNIVLGSDQRKDQHSLMGESSSLKYRQNETARNNTVKIWAQIVGDNISVR